MMNYQEAEKYIFEHLPMFTRIGGAAYKADLSGTRALCEALGNPQDKWQSIHIGGTNGKGSVSTFLASILAEHHLKVGLFTSPHLKTFRERIRINGEMIEEAFIADFITHYQRLFDELKPSFFEMSFALAAEYFKQNEVDIAVIEVGMGGRLDSTNLIFPVVSVITNIGNDHRQYLGDTIPQISAEKAGIIKPGIPVVIGEKKHETEPVFISRSKASKSPCFFAEDYMKVEHYFENEDFLQLSIFNSFKHKTWRLQSPLKGEYQLKNIPTVLMTLDILEQQGFVLNETSILKGFKNAIINTGFQGRWQVLNRKPLIVADIAHNEPGIKTLLQQVLKYSFRKLHIILGMVSDKDSQSILPLFPAIADYYFCKPDVPRGKDANLLANEAKQFGLLGAVYPSVAEALNSAILHADHEDMILVTGSAFVVAEVI